MNMTSMHFSGFNIIHNIPSSFINKANLMSYG